MSLFLLFVALCSAAPSAVYDNTEVIVQIVVPGWQYYEIDVAAAVALGATLLTIESSTPAAPPKKGNMYYSLSATFDEGTGILLGAYSNLGSLDTQIALQDNYTMVYFGIHITNCTGCNDATMTTDVWFMTDTAPTYGFLATDTNVVGLVKEYWTTEFKVPEDEIRYVLANVVAGDIIDESYLCVDLDVSDMFSQVSVLLGKKANGFPTQDNNDAYKPCGKGDCDVAYTFTEATEWYVGIEGISSTTGDIGVQLKWSATEDCDAASFLVPCLAVLMGLLSVWL